MYQGLKFQIFICMLGFTHLDPRLHCKIKISFYSSSYLLGATASCGFMEQPGAVKKKKKKNLTTCSQWDSKLYSKEDRQIPQLPQTSSRFPVSLLHLTPTAWPYIIHFTHLKPAPVRRNHFIFSLFSVIFLFFFFFIQYHFIHMSFLHLFISDLACFRFSSPSFHVIYLYEPADQCQPHSALWWMSGSWPIKIPYISVLATGYSKSSDLLLY